MLFHFIPDVSLVVDIFSNRPVVSTACGIPAWLDTWINQFAQCGYEENFIFNQT